MLPNLPLASAAGTLPQTPFTYPCSNTHACMCKPGWGGPKASFSCLVSGPACSPLPPALAACCLLPAEPYEEARTSRHPHTKRVRRHKLHGIPTPWPPSSAPPSCQAFPPDTAEARAISFFCPGLRVVIVTFHGARTRGSVQTKPCVKSLPVVAPVLYFQPRLPSTYSVLLFSPRRAPPCDNHGPLGEEIPPSSSAPSTKISSE